MVAAKAVAMPPSFAEDDDDVDEDDAALLRFLHLRRETQSSSTTRQDPFLLFSCFRMATRSSWSLFYLYSLNFSSFSEMDGYKLKNDF